MATSPESPLKTIPPAGALSENTRLAWQAEYDRAVTRAKWGGRHRVFKLQKIDMRVACIQAEDTAKVLQERFSVSRQTVREWKEIFCLSETGALLYHRDGNFRRVVPLERVVVTDGDVHAPVVVAVPGTHRRLRLRWHTQATAVKKETTTEVG